MTTGADRPPSAWSTASNRGALAALATAALAYSFMQNLVLPALPTFSSAFHASPTEVSWIASGFLVSAAVSMAIVSRLGDRHGRVLVLTLATLVFGIATLAAGFATNLPMLIACRIVQGVGGAIIPLSFSIASDQITAARGGFGIGFISSMLGIGSVVGFVLSGLILEYQEWRWLFFIGFIPILFALALLPRLPRSPKSASGPPDWIGGLFLSAGLAATMLAIAKGNSWGWTSTQLIALLACGVITLAAWTQIERFVSSPMVNMSLFGRADLVLLNISTFFIGYAMFAVYTILPGLLAADSTSTGYGFGATPLEIGIFFVPVSTAVVVGGMAAGSARRPGPLSILRIGILCLGSGLTLLAVDHSERLTAYLWMALVGAGVGSCISVLARLVVTASDPSETGISIGLNTAIRTVGAAVAVQVGAAILEGSALNTGLPTESGYSIALLTATGGAIIALAITFILGRMQVSSPYKIPA